MIVQNHRPSAQILQFPPLEARARLTSQRQAKFKMKSADLQITPASFGGAWYHDAAIAAKDDAKDT